MNIFADGTRKPGQETDIWVAPEIEPPAAFELIGEISSLSRGDAESGLPLKLSSWHYGDDGKELAYVLEAIEVKKGAIEASVFEVPAGYEKVAPFTIESFSK